MLYISFALLVDVALLSLRRIGEVVTPGKLQERLDLTVPFEEDTLARDFGVSDENGNGSSEADTEAGAPATPATAGTGLDTGCKWTSSKEPQQETVGCAVQVAHSSSEPSKPPVGGAGEALGAAAVSTTSFTKEKEREREKAAGDRRQSHSTRRGSRPAHRKRTHSHSHEADAEHAVDEGDEEHAHSHKARHSSSFSSSYLTELLVLVFTLVCG